MKKFVACVFSNVSDGSIISHEGLDLSLAVSVLFDGVGIFFISDSVFLLLSNKNFNEVVYKDFISKFGMLFSCGVNGVYLCADSACNRGLTQESIVDEVIWLSARNWSKELSCYNLVLNF